MVALEHRDIQNDCLKVACSMQSLESACRRAVEEATHAAETARRDAQSFKDKWEYCAHKLHQNDVQVDDLLDPCKRCVR